MSDKLFAATVSLVLFWVWVAILFLASRGWPQMLIAFAVGTVLVPFSYLIWKEAYNLLRG